MVITVLEIHWQSSLPWGLSQERGCSCTVVGFFVVLVAVVAVVGFVVVLVAIVAVADCHVAAAVALGGDVGGE